MKQVTFIHNKTGEKMPVIKCDYAEMFKDETAYACFEEKNGEKKCIAVFSQEEFSILINEIEDVQVKSKSPNIGDPELLGIGIVGKEFARRELEHPSKFQQRLKELQDNLEKMQSHFPKKPLITPPNLKK
ncbi:MULTISPECIES: hypothetical protein [Elizabethkingia]|nr:MULTISPECIES: hypothetical protein [Elizabethkingia]MCT3669703.1 hypothetical protein [Elizabethkingia anophelis]MCT3689568.1 hypothetical protein [Elizabethkingia anophelis]MCT3706344.1 hypothetical protein [Elizabethkingia anophelis]MCT3713362.1 hypothetical protein [Elizabethkingia anophelis]MCT3716780.1 hypothetical protein [Elizabethkingia anophelis]